MGYIYICIEISSFFILIKSVHWMDRDATLCHATHTIEPLEIITRVPWSISIRSESCIRYSYIATGHVVAGFDRIDRGSVIGCTKERTLSTP